VATKPYGGAGRSGRTGRPPLPKAKKKVRVSLSLSQGTLDELDDQRGSVPRSTYVEAILRKTGNSDTEGEARRLNGAVYTPSLLADFVAAKLLQYHLDAVGNGKAGAGRPKTGGTTELRILDPACGDGELLAAVWRRHKAVAMGNRIVRRLSPRSMCGVDVDRNAVRRAGNRLEALTSSSGRRGRRKCARRGHEPGIARASASAAPRRAGRVEGPTCGTNAPRLPCRC